MAVFAAIWLIASLIAVGLAVDLGRLYLTQRSMQRVANIAALDAARISSGCVPVTGEKLAVATNEAGNSVAVNGGQASWLEAGGVRLGQRRLADGLFSFLPAPADQSDSVEVRLSRPMPRRLMPMFSPPTKDATLVAMAHASQLPASHVTPRSFVTNISDSPVTNELVCQLVEADSDDRCDITLALDPTALSALDEAVLPLTALLPENPTSEEIRDFLDSTLNVRGLLGMIADALIAQGDSAAGAAVDAIAAASSAAQILPQDVFNIEEDFEQPLAGTTINAWTLVSGVIQQAAAGNAVTVAVDDLGLPIPVLGDTQITVRTPVTQLIQTGPPGRDSAGRPRSFARTANLLVQADLSLPPILGQPVSLSIFGAVASAEAEVTRIDCARGIDQPNSVVYVDARSRISEIGIGQFDDINAGTSTSPVPVMNLTLLGVDLTISASSIASVGQEHYEQLVFTEWGPDHRQRVGTSTSEALSSAATTLAANLTLTVDGLPDGPLGISVSQLLNPILTTLSNELTELLLADVDALLDDGLGIAIGGADFYVDEPRDAPPELFTR